MTMQPGYKGRPEEALSYDGGDYVFSGKRGPVDMSETDWGALDLNGYDYRGSRFVNSGLSGANFASANLAGVSFASSDLAAANFAGGDLRGANFTDCDLTNADFSGADLRGALVPVEQWAVLKRDATTILDNDQQLTALAVMDAQLRALGGGRKLPSA